MLDIGFDELLFTVIVAIVVIGPKDLPMALRTAGRWMGKMRRISGHFRAGVETMIRDAELEDMERKWREHNASIMQQHPPGACAEAGVELVGQDPGMGAMMLPLAATPGYGEIEVPTTAGADPEPIAAVTPSRPN